jgi:hypothetical protein
LSASFTAASGGSLLFDQYALFAILKPKNRKTESARSRTVLGGRCLMLGAQLFVDTLCRGGKPWSAPPRAVDEDPDEAGALLDFHFTNPSAGSGRV